MHRTYPALVAACTLFCAACTASSASSDCENLAKPLSGNGYEIKVDAGKVVRNLSPEFFGFNIEWVEFQLSLWDSSRQRVFPEVVEWLKAFPGAIYRYPGGTVANYFEWRSAVGNVQQRPAQTPVTWRGPLVAEFGLAEYLDFVQAVGGKPWYVMNLYGSLAGERPTAEMVTEAGAVASYLQRQAAQGKPAIYRWELGNELDRDRFMWSPSKYADAAKATIVRLTSTDKTAKAVAMAQDWDASKASLGIDSPRYNTLLAQSVGNYVSGFASHYYYDGAPWGPPIPTQIRQHCKNVAALSPVTSPQPDIWITEHGRTPRGTPEDSGWKSNWPQTADLQAAISVADMVTSMSRDSRVKGVFSHALHATNGPWPIFHKNELGEFRPSGVYWALTMLRSSLLPNVVQTVTTSGSQSGYDGGYDIRASAMTDDTKKKMTVWLVNRGPESHPVTLNVSGLANSVWTGTRKTISAPSLQASNYGGIDALRPTTEAIRISLDNQGAGQLVVPGFSVACYTVSLSN